MSNIKCPFCQQELHKDSDGYYTCYTDNCECMKYGGNGASGSESLWLALIGTMEELHKANAELEYINEQVEKSNVFDNTRKELEQSEICCAEWEKQALDYKTENIILSGRLDIAIRAFEITRDCCSDYSIECLARETLEQITTTKE